MEGRKNTTPRATNTLMNPQQNAQQPKKRTAKTKNPESRIALIPQNEFAHCPISPAPISATIILGENGTRCTKKTQSPKLPAPIAILSLSSPPISLAPSLSLPCSASFPPRLPVTPLPMCSSTLFVLTPSLLHPSYLHASLHIPSFSLARSLFLRSSCR